MTLVYLIAGIAAILFLGSARAAMQVKRARREGRYPQPGAGSVADVKKLADAGDSILAIRLYRELTKSSLKDAKKAVEEMGRKQS